MLHSTRITIFCCIPQKTRWLHLWYHLHNIVKKITSQMRVAQNLELYNFVHSKYTVHPTITSRRIIFISKLLIALLAMCCTPIHLGVAVLTISNKKFLCNLWKWCYIYRRHLVFWVSDGEYWKIVQALENSEFLSFPEFSIDFFR